MRGNCLRRRLVVLIVLGGSVALTGCDRGRIERVAAAALEESRGFAGGDARSLEQAPAGSASEVELGSAPARPSAYGRQEVAEPQSSAAREAADSEPDLGSDRRRASRPLARQDSTDHTILAGGGEGLDSPAADARRTRSEDASEQEEPASSSDGPRTQLGTPQTARVREDASPAAPATAAPPANADGAGNYATGVTQGVVANVLTAGAATPTLRTRAVGLVAGLGRVLVSGPATLARGAVAVASAHPVGAGIALLGLLGAGGYAWWRSRQR